MRRFRPLRLNAATRDRHAEVALSPQDLICPYFVVEGQNQKQPLPALGDVFRFSVDRLLEDLEAFSSLALDKILIFGVVDNHQKDEQGTAAWRPDSLVSRAVRAVKKHFPDLIVFTDVCLCGYTRHGHCGVVREQVVLNDETLPLLADMALSHAAAGADFVAPSAMMDGQVAAIRQRLDQAGYGRTKILAYSVKYASSFYGPFRDAVSSAPAFGDRKSYQMDFRTRQQALDEVAADLEEGADWVMVKPAVAYLDVLCRVKEKYPTVPLAAYHVSGECSQLRLAAEKGLINEEQALLETLYAIKRSGADTMITYYARWAAEVLKP